MHEVSEDKTKVIKESYGDRSSVLVPKKHGEILEVLHGYLQDDCGSKLSCHIIMKCHIQCGILSRLPVEP